MTDQPESAYALDPSDWSKPLRPPGMEGPMPAYGSIRHHAEMMAANGQHHLYGETPNDTADRIEQELTPIPDARDDTSGQTKPSVGIIGRIGYHYVDWSKPETMPIGYLFSVPCWLDNIAEAYGQAVGPLPEAPPLMMPNELAATQSQVSTKEFGLDLTHLITTGYTYDPGPADYDKAVIAAFSAAVTEWNDKAAVVKTMLDMMLAQYAAKIKAKP